MRSELLRRADYTSEEAFWLAPGGRWELVEGTFSFMSPVGILHGQTVTRVATALREFVEPRKLGLVVSGDAGFVVQRDPDTVLAPDVAFVAAERVPSPLPSEFFEGAPDLVVEILSPSDRWRDVEPKAARFLAAGSRSVWAIDPVARTARVYRPAGVRDVVESGALVEETLLPDFALSLVPLFV